MILFVGDKPSKQTDPNVPFKGAASEKRLVEWMRFLTEAKYEIHIVNQADDKFKWYVGQAYHFNYPIIALGNVASKRLRAFKHFKLPHPSGRNRQINDKEFIIKKLTECKEWILDYERRR